MAAKRWEPYCQWISRPVSRPDFSDEVPFPLAVSRKQSPSSSLFSERRKAHKKAQGGVYMMAGLNASLFLTASPLADLGFEELQCLLQLGVLLQRPLVGSLDLNLRGQFDLIVGYQADLIDGFPLGQEVFKTRDLNG